MTLQFVTKKDLIERAGKLRFFNKKLEQIDDVDTYLLETGGGLLKWIKTQQEFSEEESLIKNLRMVKEVIDNHGDDAINRYNEITTPNKEHPMYEHLQLIKSIGGVDFDELAIPMKKEAFEVYLEVYNEAFANPSPPASKNQ